MQKFANFLKIVDPVLLVGMVFDGEQSAVVVDEMLAEVVEDVLAYLQLTHTTVTGKVTSLNSRSKMDE